MDREEEIESTLLNYDCVTPENVEYVVADIMKTIQSDRQATIARVEDGVRLYLQEICWSEKDIDVFLQYVRNVRKLNEASNE